MAVLSVALQYYIHQRLNNDPGWKPIKVTFDRKNLQSHGLSKKYFYSIAESYLFNLLLLLFS